MSYVVTNSIKKKEESSSLDAGIIFEAPFGVGKTFLYLTAVSMQFKEEVSASEMDSATPSFLNAVTIKGILGSITEYNELVREIVGKHLNTNMKDIEKLIDPSKLAALILWLEYIQGLRVTNIYAMGDSSVIVNVAGYNVYDCKSISRAVKVNLIAEGLEDLAKKIEIVCPAFKVSRVEVDDEGRVIFFTEYKDWIDYVRQYDLEEVVLPDVERLDLLNALKDLGMRPEPGKAKLPDGKEVKVVRLEDCSLLKKAEYVVFASVLINGIGEEVVPVCGELTPERYEEHLRQQLYWLSK